MRLPISIRLTLWYGLSLLVLLALFSAVLLTAAHVNHHFALHQRLFQAQAELLPRVGVRPEGPAFEVSPDALGRVYRQEAPFGLFVRLLAPSGAVLARSPNFGESPGFAPRPPERDRIEEVEARWEGQLMRVMYAPVHTDAGGLAGWLEVSCASFELHHPFAGTPLVLAILLTSALALAGGYGLARRALRPVAALTEAANRIHAADLAVRLPVQARLRDELTDLAETFNRMLDRLQAAFERERRFSANAAHEMLNPLAALRNEAEVTLRRPRDASAYTRALQTIHADAERLGRMVEQLLQLSRLEAAAAHDRTRTDLVRLAETHLDRRRADAARLDLHLEARLPARPAVVAADPVHLGTVLDNLLDNALKYTPPGGTVTVTVTVHIAAEAAELVVADTGVGFTAGQGAQLFDRFYRADTPEVQARPGSGLGLALVRAIVEVSGGTVDAASPGLHHGSTFTVRLPLAPPPAPP